LLEYEAHYQGCAHWHLGPNIRLHVVCSLNTSNQRGVSYFLSSHISSLNFLPSRHQLRPQPLALVQQQAAPVSPTMDPETTVSRPKIKYPVVPPKMMEKMIKPLVAFMRRNCTALAQHLLVVHGQQHEDICGSKLDSKNRRANPLLRPGGDKAVALWCWDAICSY
jgi:hypothetical protein